MGINPKLTFDKPDFMIGGTFAYSINDFIDFTDLIQVENWDPQNKPKSLLYWCGPKCTSKYIPPFSDTSYPQREHERFVFKCFFLKSFF